MKIVNLVFSPTGGVKKVATELAAAWANEEVVEIDLTNKDTDFSQISLLDADACYICFPVFEGRVLKVIQDRLAAMKKDKLPTVMVAVFGNRAIDDALLEMRDEISKMGYVPVAAISASVQHSSLPQFAAGRPDADDKAELRAFNEQIKERILSGFVPEKLEVPGNYPYCVLRAPNLKPMTSDECISCGACAQSCPTGAIPVDEPNTTDVDKCVGCMRCIRICPVQARDIDHEKVDKFLSKLAKIFIERKPNTLYL